MFTVHIYAESDNPAPGCMSRMAGYVVECRDSAGKTRTVEEFREEIGTYYEVMLKTTARALGRLNQSCEVHIHSQDEYVLGMIERNLPLWGGNGFRTKKGDLVKNRFEWSRLWQILQNHLYSVEPGEHGYYMWMLGEMAKAKKEAGKAGSSGIS